MSEFRLLNSSIIIGSERFRNRIFSAPMSGQDITPQCTIGDSAKEFYELRAIGGAAAVTVSECSVHPQTDKSFMYHMNESIPGCLSSFTKTADYISRHGAIASAEISHAGMYAGSYVPKNDTFGAKTKYGPSDAAYDDITVKALDHEQIHEIAESYGKAAAFLKRCGFRMVLIHGGHGWLINQFLSPMTNHRKDKYGGCRENRYRFMLEVIDNVRKAVGPGFPIEFRMSGAEFCKGGYDQDEGIEIAKAIDGKVDLIHVSAGVHHDCFHITHPSMFEEHGRNVYLAAEIKKHVNTPVATLGGLNDPVQMETILEKGMADVIYLGRALLADPFLPQKVKEGKAEDIRKCLRCFTCMGERVSTQTRRCAIDPLIGRETDKEKLLIRQTPKTVLVAGAGPAGMEAALTAAKRGHIVLICEKTDKAGGALICQKNVDFKREMYELADTMKRQCENAGVEFRFNTTVTPDLVRSINPDALIIAIGGTPERPDIEGIDNPNVIILRDYHMYSDKVGNKVAILGGMLAGCEIAVHLAREGKKVIIIEKDKEPALDANPRHRPILLSQLEKYSIPVFTNCECSRITDTCILYTDGTQVFTEQTDTVICAFPQKPDWKTAEALQESAPFVREVGDVRKDRKAC